VIRLLLLVIGFSAILAAHDFSQSESTLTLDGPTVNVQLRLNLLDFPGVDANGNGVVSYEELDAAIERVFAAVKEHYVLGAPDAPLRILVERYEIVDDHVLQMGVRYDFAAEVHQLDVTSTLDVLFGPMHQHIVTTRLSGETSRTVLDAGNRRAHLDRSRITPWRIAAVMGAVFGITLLAWFRRRR
jgi:hypothetical protein